MEIFINVTKYEECKIGVVDYNVPDTKLKMGPMGIQKSTGRYTDDISLGAAELTPSTLSGWIIPSPYAWVTNTSNVNPRQLTMTVSHLCQMTVSRLCQFVMQVSNVQAQVEIIPFKCTFIIIHISSQCWKRWLIELVLCKATSLTTNVVLGFHHQLHQHLITENC